MARVTALRERGGRVEVELDGARWRSVPVDAAARVGLRVGLELDRPRLRELRHELRRADAGARALRALRHRDLAAAELDARLERAGFSEAERETTVERLADAGLVDDARLAARPRRGARRARSRRRRDPLGPRAARRRSRGGRGGPGAARAGARARPSHRRRARLRACHSAIPRAPRLRRGRRRRCGWHGRLSGVRMTVLFHIDIFPAQKAFPDTTGRTTNRMTTTIATSRTSTGQR